MGLFTRMMRPPEAKTTTYGPIELWRDLFGGSAARSGVSVSAQTALQTTTVQACTRRIAESYMCPCKVYVNDIDKGGRQEDTKHPLYNVLNVKPNSLQSGVDYRETVGLHLALTFNHYSYISRINGRIDELIPIPPQYVSAKVGKDGNGDAAMRYVINWPTGGQSELTQDEIWHIRGPSWEPGVGMDAIRLLREAIGLAIATEETHARFHANGAQPGGIIKTDKDLSDQNVRNRLKTEFAEKIGGVANKFRTIVLDNGLDWKPLMMTGVDSQHLQLRQFQVEEICRGFCVMPIMVGYTGDKAPTFASAEQLFLSHLVHTVRPWHRRFTASADRWLLTDADRAAGRYVSFVEADYLSPDMKAKAEFYKIGLGGSGNPAWLTPNQVRGFEEMPKHPGGDNLYAPSNTGPIQADGTVKGAAKTPPKEGDAP